MSEDWHARWREGRTAFHEGAPNAWLAEHVHLLDAGPGRRVLVPLCGKSIDLAFLAAHGFSVVGVELSSIAAEAFFVEAGLEPTRTGTRLAANGIEIVVGDFFEMSETLGLFDAYYDRAALVALPAADRVRYAAAIRGLLREGAPGLLVTYEHDGNPSTPPYAVLEDELGRLWPTFERERIDGSESPRGRITKSGATFARERVYRLRAR